MTDAGDGDTVRFISVDVGTSSVRAALAKTDGTLLGHASRPINIFRPADDYAEQSSENIWRMSCECIREVVATTFTNSADVKGLAFDATCSLVALDKDDLPVSLSPSLDPKQNVILWADQRSVHEADEINETKDVALKYVGGKISPEMQLPKLLWLKRHLPGQYAKVAKFFDLSDFLSYKSTGNDQRSCCTLTCKWTYMHHEKAWSTELFQTVGLEDLLTENKIVSATNGIGEVSGCVGCLNGQTCKETGLSRATMVAVGMIDAHCGGIGCLSENKGDLTSTLAMICGTSNCLMASNLTPAFVKNVWGPYYGAMIPGLWLSEAGQSACGSLIDFIIEDSSYYATLKAESEETNRSVYDILNSEVLKMELEPNSEMQMELEATFSKPVAGMGSWKTHVYPDFSGNRSPLADPTLRGMISGMSLNRTKRDLCVRYLATIQSICYGTRHIIEKMNAQGHQIKTLSICGGVSKNGLLLRELANITSLPLRVILGEPVLLGGVRVAAVASGYYKTLQEAMSRMPSEFEMVPVDKRCRRYHLYKYHIYREMWRDQIKYRIMMDGVNRAVFDAAIPDDIDEEAYDQRLLSGDITFEEMLFGLKKANGNLPGWLPKNNIKIPSTNAMHWFPQAKQQD
jgi:FGGY-family pentulose kinase